MIRKTILLLITTLGSIACFVCYTARRDLKVAFASIIETSDVTFAIPATNGSTTSNVYYSADGERTAHWSYSDFRIEYDCTLSRGELGVGKLITGKVMRMIDFCKLTINFPSTISKFLINTKSFDAFLDEETQYSSNVKSMTKIDDVGFVFERSDNNAVTITSPASFMASIFSFTFVVGTLTTNTPVGGYVMSGGKQAIAAFGFNYTGLPISDGSFGIAVSDDGLEYTELNNGKYSSLTSMNGNFYAYKLDLSPKNYYAKGFIRFGDTGTKTTTFTNSMQVSGDLLGNEYTI